MSIIPKEEDQRFQYIRESVLNSLGFPVVNVELTSQQLELQIDKQRFIYSKENPFLGMCIQESLAPVMDVYSVKVLDPFGRNITGIKEAFREDDNFKLFNSLFQSQFMSGNIQGIIETFTYYDIAKKTLRIDPEWTWDERTYTVRFIRAFQTKIKTLIFYFYFPLLKDIPETDLLWIINYQLQEQKEILGRIRSKISSLQTSVGQFALDGGVLLSEQFTEKLKLEEEMKLRHSHYIEPITIF